MTLSFKPFLVNQKIKLQHQSREATPFNVQDEQNQEEDVNEKLKMLAEDAGNIKLTNKIFKRMKNLKIVLITLSFISLLACSSTDDSIDTDLGTTGSSSDVDTEIKCGFHNGNQLWKGPQGGCYYYNSSGNKTYVDRDECDC
ncbi:hypothetical protein [Kordia sp.]|uniref:hypothetical protein n=1 Tax=Kordia sp. TaxID=1965332 RepID=UPI003B590370